MKCFKLVYICTKEQISLLVRTWASDDEKCNYTKKNTDLCEVSILAIFSAIKLTCHCYARVTNTQVNISQNEITVLISFEIIFYMIFSIISFTNVKICFTAIEINRKRDIS